MNKIIIFLAILVICQASLSSDMLSAHNAIRKQAGVKSLVWSSRLAAASQNWANYLAKNDLRKHSGMVGYGENFGRGKPPQNYPPIRIFNQFVAERKYYVGGRLFPHVSTTGSYSDVAHYTQLIWGDTKQVGCGYAQGNRAVLVCRYEPKGNILGEAVK